jgi:hypothetical protein
MRNKMILTKYLVFGLVIALIGSCSSKANNSKENKPDSLAQKTKLADQNLNGTFEYSEPLDESYLYFKIDLKQNGDSLSGKLWGGVYLAKSEENGFTNPTVLAECSVKGMIKDDVVEMQLVVTKTERMEEDAPDLLGMMNFPDLDTDVTATIWAFNYENGALVSQNGLLMPDGKTPVKFIWEKLK